MPRLWTITAQNDEGTEIYVSAPFQSPPPRDTLVAALCGAALEKAGGLVPDGKKGMTPEERLAELGYTVTSITDTDPAG